MVVSASAIVQKSEWPLTLFWRSPFLPGVHLRNVEGRALEDYLLPLPPQLPLPPSLPTTSFSFYSIPTPPYKPPPNSLPSHLSSSLGLPSSFTSGWWTHEFTDDKTWQSNKRNRLFTPNMGANKTITMGCDSEFLYLGTLVNSQGVNDNRRPADRTVDDSSLNTRKLASPELHPLPPLARHHSNGGEDEAEEE